MHSMKLSLLAGLFSVIVSTPAHSNPVSDLLGTLGLNGLAGDALSIDARILNPGSTSGNDTVGLDLLNRDRTLGVFLDGNELLGFSDNSAVPLNQLGLEQLLTGLGLAGDDTLAVTLRDLVGPEGAVIVPVVDGIEELSGMLAGGGFDLASALALPGLADQPIALALLGEPNSGNTGPDGLLGVALITDGTSGNGGLVGVAVISGDNAGRGELAGVSILSGDGSGTGGLAGVAVLSGNGAGTSETIGLGALNGNNSGQGGLLGGSVLNGDNSGTGGVAGIGVLSGDSSGSGDIAGIGVLSGENVAGSDTATISVLNAGTDGNAGPITVAALNTGDSGDNPDSANLPCEGVACDNTPAEELLPLVFCSLEGGDCQLDEHLIEGQAYVLHGVNFEFTRAELTADSSMILERATAVLKRQPDLLVAIDGHTDGVGSADYNRRLSTARAQEVFNYFVAAGVSPDRLVYRGFGKSRPVAPNTLEDGTDNPEGRAKNRRVELTVVDADTFAQIAQRAVASRDADSSERVTADQSESATVEAMAPTFNEQG